MKKCCEQQHIFDSKMLKQSLALNEALLSQAVGWVTLRMMYFFRKVRTALIEATDT
jgi:hypothetical protein